MKSNFEFLNKFFLVLSNLGGQHRIVKGIVEQ